MLCRYCAYLKQYKDLAFGELVFVELNAGDAPKVEGLCTKYLRPVARPYVRCRGFRQSLGLWRSSKTLLDLMVS